MFVTNRMWKEKSENLCANPSEHQRGDRRCWTTACNVLPDDHMSVEQQKRRSTEQARVSTGRPWPGGAPRRCPGSWDSAWATAIKATSAEPAIVRRRFRRTMRPPTSSEHTWCGVTVCCCACADESAAGGDSAPPLRFLRYFKWLRTGDRRSPLRSNRGTGLKARPGRPMPAPIQPQTYPKEVGQGSNAPLRGAGQSPACIPANARTGVSVNARATAGRPYGPTCASSSHPSTQPPKTSQRSGSREQRSLAGRGAEPRMYPRQRTNRRARERAGDRRSAPTAGPIGAPHASTPTPERATGVRQSVQRAHPGGIAGILGGFERPLPVCSGSTFVPLPMTTR